MYYQSPLLSVLMRDYIKKSTNDSINRIIHKREEDIKKNLPLVLVSSSLPNPNFSSSTLLFFLSLPFILHLFYSRKQQ